MKGLKISEDGTRVAVIIYSTEVETSFGLTEYYSMVDIEPVVFGLTYMAGVTNTADGIMEGRRMIADQGRGTNVAQPIMCLITDGKSNVDTARTLPEAQLAKDAGIEVFSIGKLHTCIPAFAHTQNEHDEHSHAPPPYTHTHTHTYTHPLTRTHTFTNQTRLNDFNTLRMDDVTLNSKHKITVLWKKGIPSETCDEYNQYGK